MTSSVEPKYVLI